MKKLLLALGAAWIAALPAPAQQPAPPPPGEFRQLPSRWRGDDVVGRFLTADIVRYVAQQHGNALRIHIDADPAAKRAAPTDVDPLAPYAGNMKILDEVLPICRANGIQVILAAGDIYGRKIDVFWADTVEGSQNRQLLAQFWTAVSRRYKDEPAIVGYDVENEPTYEKGQASEWWGHTLPECIRAIRQNDETAWIVVEPHMAFADDFRDMPVIDDPRVIYSFHTYWPHGYTHQGVRFRQGRYKEDSKGKWTYPGMAPRVEGPDLDNQTNMAYWDKEAVRKTMQPVIDFQKKHPGTRILCGEFGVIRWAPNAAVYLKDMIDLLEEYGWDWTFHAVGEWNGWDPTYAAEDDTGHNRPSFLDGLVETDRLQVLKAGWSLNVPAAGK